MAVNAQVHSISVSMLLNNGLDADGNVKTTTASLPKIDVETYTDNVNSSRENVMNVVGALENLITLDVYTVREVQTSYLQG